MTKRVLLTGGAGFIAHHVVKRIIDSTDWDIVCLDRLDFSGNLNRLHQIMDEYDPDYIRERVKIIYHDLKAEISPLLSKQIGRIDIVLHLAAGSHVDRSIDYPLEFVMDNVVGTCNILEFAKSQDFLERFVYFSTDEVFGPAPKGVNYTERARYNSTNPYSASKAGGEELCVAFENTYDMPIFITHTMNVFGERQHPEKFIPTCVRKILNKETVYIHSDYSKTIPGSRHYIHASDVADGLMYLLNLPSELVSTAYQPDFGGAKCPKFNLVGKQEVDNFQLAQYIADALGEKLYYEFVDFHSSRPGHDLRYALSGEYMKSLGWEPRVELTERITQVAAWTARNPEWMNL